MKKLNQNSDVGCESDCIYWCVLSDAVRAQKKVEEESKG